MTRAKKSPKRKAKEDDLTPIAMRAENALGQRWSEDAECMGDECEWYQQGCPAHPAKKSKK